MQYGTNNERSAAVNEDSHLEAQYEDRFGYPDGDADGRLMGYPGGYTGWDFDPEPTIEEYDEAEGIGPAQLTCAWCDRPAFDATTPISNHPLVEVQEYGAHVFLHSDPEGDDNYCDARWSMWQHQLMQERACH